ncbi:2-oxoacid:acceptor oxidoreductase subunit alpha [Clostridium sp. D2Q-11]|uniref:2-oxoacid:acceptor oxidoreductase subunit alpha n=1 Tax=Anaeromonas frigoriresistens TaxID=2683708 RepID=A0A942V0F5_9FIRM|nr:2-oxoacid:acceptor oxidoreductase subunit alpha [Anaeromonas frigoriresistens]MBS4540139.1 2-oxoacid:acceptor oxidoreductase subunit alpha [Anaeromonas frigoriresistens]
MNYNILIGGAAGQGVATTGKILESILKRKGYFVFTNKDYMSRVRGGHNFTQIRFGNDELYSHNSDLDIILAFNKETIINHSSRLKDNGIIICDYNIDTDNYTVNKLPLIETAKDVGNAKVFTSVAIGAILKAFDIEVNNTTNLLNKFFKDENLINLNYAALVRGYDMFKNVFTVSEPKLINKDTISINGNQAIALGALAGGVTFYSAYPMAPSTGIMKYLYSKSNSMNILVEQAEDEIAAINMAIGASYAGARSMTASSGGGFSLMVEGLGLAAITETPLVVVNVQRPGPATGLPTRTAQGDLGFVINSSQDDLPLMVISLKNHQDAFYQTIRALNLADKYQLLVIILSDQYLADSSSTIEKFNFDDIKIDRNIAKKNNCKYSDTYKRYEYTDDGISPRLIPGNHNNITVLADSHEHNEYGNIDESKKNRINMMDKRMNKIKLVKKDLIEPEYYGMNNPETLLVAWGSSEGSIKEALELLSKENVSIGALVFGDIWPLPIKKMIQYSNIAKTIISVEHNHSNQLAKLISQELQIKFTDNINKYDGRQFSGYELYKSIKEVL